MRLKLYTDFNPKTGRKVNKAWIQSGYPIFPGEVVDEVPEDKGRALVDLMQCVETTEPATRHWQDPALQPDGKHFPSRTALNEVAKRNDRQRKAAASAAESVGASPEQITDAVNQAMMRQKEMDAKDAEIEALKAQLDKPKRGRPPKNEAVQT